MFLNQNSRGDLSKHKKQQLQFIIETLLKQYEKPQKSQTPCNVKKLMEFGPHTTKANIQRVNFFQPEQQSPEEILQTEIEVSEYMLPRRLMKLGDPLIDDAHMVLDSSDLVQRVPFLWMPSSDEATTISRSDSFEDYVAPKDKTQQFKERFMVGKQIGSGSYASVRHCFDKQTLKTYALKIYSKHTLTASRKRSILREIRLLQYIKHPNIIKIHDALETNNHVNLLLEIVQGNSLAQLYKTKPFSLPQIKSILSQTAGALAYLHNLHITHRDIKLENILYTSKEGIKLIDFGFSTLMRQKKKMYCGTPSYMAPEIVRRTNFKGQPVDIWALGITLYALLCKQFPFKGTNDKDLYFKISNGDYSLSLVEDDDAKDLLSRMICVKPEYRITADEILQHPFLNKRTYDMGALLTRVKRHTVKHESHERKPSFFTQKVQSCLNSPRNHDSQNHQSTVKKMDEERHKNYFKLTHNQTIQPSFVPSFMSSVSQDHLMSKRTEQQKRFQGNQTFNDMSGPLNVSFNNSVLYVQQNKFSPFRY